jgi:hypothetical protein
MYNAKLKVIFKRLQPEMAGKNLIQVFFNFALSALMLLVASGMIGDSYEGMFKVRLMQD